jgi:hypothetical protein
MKKKATTGELLEIRRRQGVAMYKKGFNKYEVAEALGVKQASMSRWIACEAESGEDGLRCKPRTGPEPKLNGEQKNELISLLLRNPSVDFHGENRSNKTHESTTDPEARLAKKGKGKESKLCFNAHVLMENRNGLCLDFLVTHADGYAERDGAVAMLDDHKFNRGKSPKTLGADKGYHTKDFIADLRERLITPHVAAREKIKTPGLDGRTTNSAAYKISQKKRKRVEEIFGWAKTVGGLRKTRFIGVELTQHFATFVGLTYNLLRMANLAPT